MRTRQTVVYFVKQIHHQSRDISAHAIFIPTKFCQVLTNLKGVEVLLRSRTRFCRAWRFFNLRVMIQGK